MNLLRKPDRVDIFFYEEDSGKELGLLKENLLEMSNILTGQKVRIKFQETEVMTFPVLSLILSFFVKIKNSGGECILVVPEKLEIQLLELGIGKLPDSLERVS
ncbi:MAG: hypothetical protein KDK36_01360 [Leptospiraceae bacterium]|nr:hypothetical protein [Leptospiraceae bacterium]